MKLKIYPMPSKLYRVKLTEAERNELKALISAWTKKPQAAT